MLAWWYDHRLHLLLASETKKDQIWDLFEHNHLFKARNAENKLDDGRHLAEMIAILEDPRLEFFAKNEKSRWFWDENGWYDLDIL